MSVHVARPGVVDRASPELRAQPGGERVQKTGGSNAFELRIPLSKMWESESGELRFEGVASSTALDKQRERMSQRAIESMSHQTGLDLLPSHDAGPLRELGAVEECWVDNEQFRIGGRLDASNPEVYRLQERLNAGKQYGLSVGGRVTAAHWEFDQEAGETIRIIDDVVLDHVALCRPGMAANPDAYLAVMAKAADAIAPESWMTDRVSGCVTEAAGSGEIGLPRTGDDAGGGTNAGEHLSKLGRFLVELSRSLWPLGGEDADCAEEDGVVVGQADVLEELAEVRKQMAQVTEELHSLSGARDASVSLDKVMHDDGEEPGTATGAGKTAPEKPTMRVRQRKQSLDGQERTMGRRTHLWKGVL